MATTYKVRAEAESGWRQTPYRFRSRRQSRHQMNDGSVRLARALGWFSIGLGLAELLAPRQLARMIGTGDHHAVMRTLGLREIAAGLAVLVQPKSATPLWTRVAGDAMDLAFLSAAMASPRADRAKIAGATAAVVGVTFLDVICAMQLGNSTARRTRARHAHVVESIIVDRPAEEIYQFWRDFENLPRFMNHLAAVRVLSDRRSRWTAKAPGGGEVSWESEITDDRPDESIAWRSLDGADVANSGIVRFDRAPGGRGTQVTVDLHYRPPGGMLGAVAAKMSGENPEHQIQEDLRRLKRLMEAGEIPTTAGQPAGRRSGMLGGASAIQMLERIT